MDKISFMYCNVQYLTLVQQDNVAILGHIIGDPDMTPISSTMLPQPHPFTRSNL